MEARGEQPLAAGIGSRVPEQAAVSYHKHSCRLPEWLWFHFDGPPCSHPTSNAAQPPLAVQRLGRSMAGQYVI